MAASRQPPAAVSSSSICSSEVAEQSSTTNTSLSSCPPATESTMPHGNMDVKTSPGSSSNHKDLDGDEHPKKFVPVEASCPGASSDVREEASERVLPSKYDPEATFDEAHRAASSLSRKPSSLDGKSATSANTFGIDEKESLRPDDSASAKATEDEDAFPAPGPPGVGSRADSEEGPEAIPTRFYGLSHRIRDSDQREPAATTTDQESDRFPGTIGTENAVSADAGSTPALAKPVTLNGGGVPFGFSLEPDGKLVEALENPKDRLFMLRLEQDVIEFVKDSKEQYLEVPPCNSFCRLLAHKLADYYFLTHFLDPKLNSVRIYRTPFCRLPPPLTGISNPPTSGNTPPPSGPAVKIMRRGAADDQRSKGSPGEKSLGDLNGRPSSASPGDEDPDGTREGRDEPPPKERGNLTREEREAKYREARERIFKGFDETENDDKGGGVESTKHSSRSSSRTGRGKSGNRRNRNNDDGFELRSQYAAFFPPQQQGFQSYGAAPAFFPYTVQSPTFAANDVGGFAARDLPMQTMVIGQQPSLQPVGTFPSSGHAYSEPSLDATAQPFPQSGHSNPTAYSRSNASSPLAAPAEYLASAFQPALLGSLPTAGRQAAYLLPSQPPKTQWSSFPAHTSYQAEAPNGPAYPRANDSQNMASSHVVMASAYPYGQLPTQLQHSNGFRMNSQHPVPGSFTRRTFNPQTQPFVPGPRQAMVSAQPYPTQPPHATNFQNPYSQAPPLPASLEAPINGAPHAMTSHLSAAHMPQSSNGARYGAAMQGAPNSLPAVHNSPQPDHHHHPPLASLPQAPHRKPTVTNEAPRWNHPASLPAKPPPNVVSPHQPAVANGGYPGQRRAGFSPGPIVGAGPHMPSTSSSSIGTRSPRPDQS